MKNKKGISGLSNSVVSLGVAAIVLVMIVLILNGFTDSDILKTNTGLVNNESSSGSIRASANASGYSLAQSNLAGFTGSIITVYNTTSTGALGFLIPSTNYTLSSSGVLSNATATTYNFVNVTYSYKSGGDAYLPSNKTLNSTANFSNYWTIIVLAIVAAVVLGIIFGIFGNKGGR